jgi:hypothetical protein
MFCVFVTAPHFCGAYFFAPSGSIVEITEKIDAFSEATASPFPEERDLGIGQRNWFISCTTFEKGTD